MKLADFNRIVNPNDEACYIVKTPTETITKAKFGDIKTLLKTRTDISLGMYVPTGLIVIEITDACVAETIKRRNEQLMVVKKGEKYYIYGKSNFNKQTINNILACGVSANTLVHTKKGTEILLPFHSVNNTLEKYANVEFFHDNGIGPLPLWLTPLRRSNSQTDDGYHYPIKENATRLLINHIINIASFKREQQVEIINIINDNLIVPPLENQTIEGICESIADEFLSQFMTKTEFFHDKLGDYIIQACNIRKDKKSHKIYFYNDEKNIYTDDPNYLRGYITKLCPRLKQHQKDETIKYITDVLELDAVNFNSNEFNIVFKNGILHLDDMEFEPMSPEHLETIQINANYNPNAHSDIADQFFNNVTCGDIDTQTLLYESIGYAMLKTVQLAKSFMVTGYGRNGKSTFYDLLTAILGEDNCAALAPNDLSNNFRSSTLVGKLASIAADVSGKPLNDTDVLKNIAAGDRIQVEKKFQDAYEERLFSTLFFGCNKLPKTPDNTPGYYRRWVIIPFNADLSKVKNVEGLTFKKKLLSQESIDYVAYKAVQAIYKVFNETLEFTQPASVAAMLNSYKISNSSVLSWFKERFVKNKTNPTAEEREAGIRRIQDMFLTDAYTNYADWCQDTNKQKLSRPNFEEELRLQFGIEWDSYEH